MKGMSEEEIEKQVKALPFIVVRTEKVWKLLSKFISTYDKEVDESDLSVMEDLLACCIFLTYIAGKGMEKVRKHVEKRD